MPRLDISVEVVQFEQQEGMQRTIYIKDKKTKEIVHEIYFHMLADWHVPEPEVLDGFLFGVIFYAMERAASLHIEGPISRVALRNLREFQEAWHSWRPQKYEPIPITAEEYVDAGQPLTPHAIAAFSGGVDSIFTVLRHAPLWQAGSGDDGCPRYDLDDSVLMVHGFDVPLDRLEELDALQARTKDFLSASGLKLRTIRTNIKNISIQKWEDSHAAQLFSCLYNYSHLYDICLIGSTDPYNALALPWGSNPATDHLLSGARMRTVHDGAGFTRPEKIARIAQEPVATAAIKVCWEGPRAFENCGRCEKCLRTQLAFKAAGIDRPSCFDTALDEAVIRNVRLRNDVQAARMASVLQYVRARNIEAPWVTALERRMATYRAARRIAPLRRVAAGGRRRMKSLLKAAIPLERFAKSTYRN